MMRLAMPKGRNLPVALAAFRAAGLRLEGLEKGDRRLHVTFPGDDLEMLFLKDWDVPRYVEYGIADCGVVGTDVLNELEVDLLAPVRFLDGRSRLSLVGPKGAMPQPGRHVRLATKYPQTARRMLASRPWGAEILPLSGSIELAPLLDLAEVALDIVQTGRTLVDNGLEELEVVHEVAPCLIAGRAAFQTHRQRLNTLLGRLEAAATVEV